MTEIFVSYSQKDREWVNQLVDSLIAEGYQVWWDIEIRAGEPFDKAIERALPQAKCVIVVWSRNARDSDFVRAESGWARQHNKLVSIRIENELDLPIEFFHVQTENFSAWDGSRDAPEFRKLLRDVQDIAGPPAAGIRVSGSTEHMRPALPTEHRVASTESDQDQSMEARGAGEVDADARKGAWKKFRIPLMLVGVVSFLMMGAILWQVMTESVTPEQSPQSSTSDAPVELPKRVDPDTLDTATVQSINTSSFETVRGVLIPNREIRLQPGIVGRITFVAGEEGDAFEEGAELIKIVGTQDREEVLTAPFPGTIIESSAIKGEIVQVGQVLMRFGNLDYMQIRAEVPVRLVRGLSKGMVIHTRLMAINLQSRVAKIGLVASPEGNVTVIFDPPAGIPGGAETPAELLIPDPDPDPSKTLLVIPKGAVHSRNGRAVVQVLTDDDFVEMREVQVGDELGDSGVIVLSGLKEGEKIVLP